MTAYQLQTSDATLAYDVDGPLPTADGRPPLFMIGQPMDSRGFETLASHFTDRTVVRYDPRGLHRSTRRDGRVDQRPEQQAQDVHEIIAAVGVAPVDMFASSGGAVTALALVAAHPDDVATLVAHEPPLVALLPDAELALAGERINQEAYQAKGSAYGMAGFIAYTSWQGQFTQGFLAGLPGDPAQFGLPATDDGSRDDPLLSGVASAITRYRPDVAAIRAAPTRVVIAAGEESEATVTWRTSVAMAELLTTPLTVFPSHHGGFLGGQLGYGGQPEAFAARLREVLAGAT
ncbi:MAG TPA: alpha/beta hydrolase [Dermatophilaceae bacterium]|nr:alpha/beta hydrolase [Dermatophilaceae bacterium]